MPTQEDIDQQRGLLDTYRRTLAHYLHRKSIIGEAYLPPEVTHGIREARDNIRRVKQILRTWGVVVTDHPDDEDVAAPLQQPSLSAPPTSRPQMRTETGGCALTVLSVTVLVVILIGVALTLGRTVVASMLSSSVEIVAARAEVLSRENNKKFVRLYITIENKTSDAVSLPLFGYFTAVDSQGMSYAAKHFASNWPDRFPPEQRVEGSIDLEAVPMNVSTLTANFTIFGGLFPLNKNISAKNIRVPE